MSAPAGYIQLPSGFWIGPDGSGPYFVNATTGAAQAVGGASSLTAAQVAALKAAGTPAAPGTIIIDPSSPYSVLGVVDGAGELVLLARAQSGSILTAAGTYTGTGSALSVSLGWKPDLVVVKGESSAASVRIGGGIWWYGKTLAGTAIAHVASGIFATATGFDVGTDASVNTNTTVYHYIAVKDNDSASIYTGDYAGNGLVNHVVNLTTDFDLAAAVIKRDNSYLPVVADRSVGAYFIDGTSGPTVSIDSDGTMTVGSEASVNEWSGNAGEATSVVGFANNGNVFVGLYTGNGSAGRVIPFAFEPDALMIFPRSSSSKSATLWVSSLATGDHLPMEAAAKATGRITSVVGSRMIVSSDANINGSASQYMIIAIRRIRNGSILSAAWPLNRPQRIKRNVWIDATGSISMGTSDTLNIAGALTLEWYGVHFNTNITAMSPGGATVNDQAFQMPMLWRQNGSDGSSSTGVNWGMGIFSPSAGTSSSSRDAGLWVAVTNRFNLMQSGSFDVDANQPWQTGVPITPRQPAHVMVTHNGFGRWRVYLNGVMVKDRDVNLTTQAVALPNIAGVSGATTTINGRKRGTASIDHTTFTQVFNLARVYSRELTKAECAANFESLFTDGLSSATPDFVEEWDANNASGSSLPATNNPANNGTLTNAQVMGI